MNIEDVIRIESYVSADRSIRIPFEFTNTDSVPEGKTIGDSIVITPITIRTWFRMKPLLMQLGTTDLNQLVACSEVMFDASLQALVEKYDEIIFEIVCLGIYNRKGEMPEWFRETLKDNCTWEDLYILLNTIFSRLRTNSFINTITLLRNVSPLGEEEIIALRENKKSWVRKAISCF